MKVIVHVFRDDDTVTLKYWTANWPEIPRIGDEVAFREEGKSGVSHFQVTHVHWYFAAESKIDGSEDFARIVGDLIDRDESESWGGD